MGAVIRAEDGLLGALLPVETPVAIAEMVDPPRLWLEAVEEFVENKSVKVGVAERAAGTGLVSEGEEDARLKKSMNKEEKKNFLRKKMPQPVHLETSCARQPTNI